MRNFISSIILVFCAVLYFTADLAAANWDDLDEGEKTYYGSEKEKRFSINAGAIEKESWEDHYSFMIFGLYKYTDYPKYKSLRVLPFYYNLQSKIDSRKRTFIPVGLTYWSSGDQWSFSISPLHYNNKSSGAYDRSWLWLFWYGSSADKTDYYNGLFPLYGYSRKKTDSFDDLFFISPVYYYQRNTSPSKESYNSYNHISPFHYYESLTRESTGEQKYTVWFPVLPLFYRYYNNNGINGGESSHTNIFWLFDIKRKDKTLERLWAAPLFFYNPDDYLYVLPFYMGSSEGVDERSHRIALLLKFTTGKPQKPRSIHAAPLIFHRTMEGGYRYYIPFYCRPSGWTEDRGYSYGIFHYHKWSPEKDITWFLPYYSWDDKSEKNYFTLLLPLYASWKNDSSSGKVYPWSVDYISKKYSLHANIFGFSWSASAGVLPDEVWGSGGGNPWHLDTEFSFLYNIFSVSNRTSFTGGREKSGADEPTLEDIEQNKDALTAVQKPVTVTGTRVSKKQEFTLENSVSFKGWQFLFGIAAYEHGDTRRHFRLLPLSWLTWDESSDDRLKVIAPFYYSYSSETDNIDYFVLFPFYGAQRDGDSYTRAYLMNAYWDEYNAESKRSEQSILWPVFNRYSSPENSGFRIFPIFWHNNSHDEKHIKEKNFSPILFYSSSVKYTATSDTKYRFHINPAWYYDYSDVNNRKESLFWAPLIPLYYRSWDTAPSVKPSPESADGLTDSSNLSWLLPLYFYSSYQLHPDNEKTFIAAKWFVLPLLMYYGFEDTTDSAAGKTVTDEYTFFMAGFYKAKSPSKEETSLLNALYSREYFIEQNKHETTLAYGLVKYISKPDSSYFRIFPLWSSEYTESAKNRSLLLGLWSSENLTYINNNGHEHSSMLLWGLYNSSRSAYYQSGSRITGEEYKVTESDSMLIPLYYSEHVTHTDERDQSKIIKAENWFWFPIIPMYYTHKNAEGADELTMRVHTRALFPVYYSSADRDGVHNNFLLLADWQRNTEGHLERLWLLPLLMYYPDTHPTVIFPALLSGYTSDTNSKTKVILGTYWHTSPEYNNQNIWLLFDHRETLKDNKTVSEKYDYLMYTVRYAYNENAWSFNILAGLGASAWSYYEQEKWGFDLMVFLATVEKNGSRFSSGIFPLWYYKSTEDDWWALSLASMSYLSHDKDSDFDLALLGTLYLRDRDEAARSDLKMVLLGTLWHERVRPENGYHSKGMFWGLLWDYETESETGFKKFSILKGLYKRVELEGNVKTKYFWIL